MMACSGRNQAVMKGTARARALLCLWAIKIGRGAVIDHSQVDPGILSIYFIGMATLLIRCGDFTILTDPNFIHKHEQVALGYGMHASR